MPTGCSTIAAGLNYLTLSNDRHSGLIRETLTYDGTSTSCTSNNQYWSAKEQ
jgi:hypothetical protein